MRGRVVQIGQPRVIMKSRNTGDWIIAILVVVCSGILFTALAFALSGASFGATERSLQVHFKQALGISPGSQVRYAGALAGTVAGMRIRTLEERQASKDPENAVAITLNILRSVPVIPSDVQVVIASETLLSDKVIQIEGGSASAPPLDESTILQGETPVSFDRLIFTANGTLENINHVLGGTGNEAESVFAQLRSVLTQAQGILAEAQTLLNDAKPVVADAGILAADARQLVAENREPLRDSIAQLDRTATDLHRLIQRGNTLLQDNEKNLNTSLTNFRITSQNLKVTATYAKFLLDSLARRPSQLLWGTRRPPELPTEEEILSSSKPIPLN